MRVLKLLTASLAYWIVAVAIYLLITLQCGLGPDSPYECNMKADLQAAWFGLASFIVYFGAALAFWRWIADR